MPSNQERTISRFAPALTEVMTGQASRTGSSCRAAEAWSAAAGARGRGLGRRRGEQQSVRPRGVSQKKRKTRYSVRLGEPARAAGEPSGRAVASPVQSESSEPVERRPGRRD